MIWGLIIFLILLVAAGFFIFPKASPVPYFPSYKEIPDVLIDFFEKRKKEFAEYQILADLGAGDGSLIFSLAKKNKAFSWQYLAVEINPFLVFFMHLRKFFGRYSNVQVRWADFFSFEYDFSQKMIFYLYLSPEYLNKLAAFLRKNTDGILISYFYKPESLEIIRKIKLKNGRYLYICRL